MTPGSKFTAGDVLGSRFLINGTSGDLTIGSSAGSAFRVDGATGAFSARATAILSDSASIPTARVLVQPYPVASSADTSGIQLTSLGTSSSVDGAVSVNAGVQLASQSGYPIRMESTIASVGSSSLSSQVIMRAGFIQGNSPSNPSTAGIYLDSANIVSVSVSISIVCLDARFVFCLLTLIPPSLSSLILFISSCFPGYQQHFAIS